MEDCICRDGKDHTLSEYQTSSRAGCWLCSIVLEITQEMKPSWLGECDNNSRRSISVSRPYGFTFKGDGEYTSYCALVFRSGMSIQSYLLYLILLSPPIRVFMKLGIGAIHLCKALSGRYHVVSHLE